MPGTQTPRMAPSHRAVADESCVTVCQELRPHCGHLRYLRGWPDAFQRMPPPSQTDFANPHWQRTIQERELASIDSARRRGITAFRMCWIKLIAVAPFLMWQIPSKALHCRTASASAAPQSAASEAYRVHALVRRNLEETMLLCHHKSFANSSRLISQSRKIFDISPGPIVSPR